MYNKQLSRQNLRKAFRQKRNQLSAQEQQTASQHLNKNLLDADLLSNKTNRVALYLANDGELSLEPTIQYCWENDISTYLPVLHPFAKGHLIFLEYSAQSKMIENRFGIPEPMLASHKLCPVSELNLIFTPLVAFDVKGNRLGMGGGFYDRTLQATLTLKYPPEIIGVAHDCQEAAALPIESWDIPLSKICTPSRMITSDTRN